MTEGVRPELLAAGAVVPLHAEPDSRAEQVTQALLGARMLLLRREAGWARCRMADGYEGWCRRELLAPIPAGWDSYPTAQCRELHANLRQLPDYRQAGVLSAPLAARLPLVKQCPEWLGLLVPDGRVLWTEVKRFRVARPGHALAPLPLRAGAILRTAHRLRGCPYLWGGCSPAGIDCSGLVQLVFGLHGLPLPRDAHQQAECGRPAPDGPAPADLLFFTTGPDRSHISHVALSLDAGRFLHAAGSDRVRVDRLASARWREMLHSVRRLL